MSFHIGETFGDYQITGIIGAGSMGQVFQAEHRLTKRLEAVKVVAAECAAERQIQRFQREIAVQAALNHPNIAAVHNAMHIDGKFVLVMEFIEGQTLENLLQTGKLPLDAGLDYIRQTLSALGYAHARGVIHRDVTPANLIVTTSGTVKLTDFGVAKAFGDVQLTNCGEVVGSLQYMAPEQIRGNSPPDPRSDLYSVGAILYEIVTRRKPFEESTVLLRLAQQEPEPRRPTEVDETLSSKWDGIVMRALAKDSAERYQSADQFLRALPSARPAPVLGAARNLVVKRSTLLKTMGIASAIGVALFAAVGPAASRFRVPPPPRPVTFRIAPPESPAPRPVVIARTLVRRQPTVKRHASPRVPKQALPLQNDLPLSSTEASVAPTPQPLTVESQVQAAEVQPVQPEATRVTPVESIPQNPAPPPQKKRIWSKFNPFRKKKAETALGPSQN
jgi:serine/threonine-protein kinase